MAPHPTRDLIPPWLPGCDHSTPAVPSPALALDCSPLRPLPIPGCPASPCSDADAHPGQLGWYKAASIPPHAQSSSPLPPLTCHWAILPNSCGLPSGTLTPPPLPHPQASQPPSSHCLGTKPHPAAPLPCPPGPTLSPLLLACCTLPTKLTHFSGPRSKPPPPAWLRTTPRREGGCCYAPRARFLPPACPGLSPSDLAATGPRAGTNRVSTL